LTIEWEIKTGNYCRINIMNSKEELTEEERKKKAYRMGLQLKNAGLDAETIYARLEKQGIPEELARQVARNAVIERRREVSKASESDYQFALLRIGIGLALALVFYLIFPETVILPTGLIIGGIVSALLAKRR
jgi:transcription initiation factor TFIIIB Brf1 subunit/transcription initiation factor TFIIB